MSTVQKTNLRFCEKNNYNHSILKIAPKTCNHGSAAYQHSRRI